MKNKTIVRQSPPFQTKPRRILGSKNISHETTSLVDWADETLQLGLVAFNHCSTEKVPFLASNSTLSLNPLREVSSEIPPPHRFVEGFPFLLSTMDDLRTGHWRNMSLRYGKVSRSAPKRPEESWAWIQNQSGVCCGHAESQLAITLQRGFAPPSGVTLKKVLHELPLMQSIAIVTSALPAGMHAAASWKFCLHFYIPNLKNLSISYPKKCVSNCIHQPEWFVLQIVPLHSRPILSRKLTTLFYSLSKNRGWKFLCLPWTWRWS